MMDPTDRYPLDTQTETRTADTREPTTSEGVASVPGLVIAAHPDPSRIGEEVPLTALASGSTVRLSRREPEFLPPTTEAVPRPLGSAFLSRRPLLLTPGAEGGLVLRRGDSPIDVRIGDELLGESWRFGVEELERGVVLVLAGRIVLLLQPLFAVPPPDGPTYGLVGHSPAMVRLRQEIHAASLLQVSVLLRGETGTGKELVARAIHDARPSKGPYVTVNLGALVPNLAASELFGATRGAYTGAERQREGFFRRADGGTLFLDEIGEAPVEIQVMLLRTLETSSVQPVGGGEERKVNVRVIAATDADLGEAIHDGRFRPALLHRLAGYEIYIPPLRQRRGDIPRLLMLFLQRETEELGEGRAAGVTEGPWPPIQVMARLIDHDWPGNVRELQNVSRRLAVWRHVEGASDPGPLLDQLLGQGSETSEPIGVPTSPSLPRRGRRTGADVEPEELVRTLEQADWQPGPAAKALGLSRQALYRLIDGHPDLRTAAELEAGEIERALSEGGSLVSTARTLRVSLQGLKRRITALGLDDE